MAIYTTGLTNTALNRVTATAATPCCCPACTGLQCLDRTRFFAGQLLSEADLNNEQSYWLAKSRLHNRYLNGWGVVCGMQVVCGECDGWVTVQSGYAIDPCGNDIIVCENQNFNVLKAIQACCAPAKKQTANCSPLRYNPSPTCKGSKQEWCITIQYREQASRMVTPLTNATSQSTCSCGCGSGKTNGGSGGSNASSGSCSSSSAAQSTSSTAPAGACEATRIVEGFELGVVPATEVAAELKAVSPGSLTYQLDECTAGLLALAEQMPKIDSQGSSEAAYQSLCSFFSTVQSFFSADTTLTHCSLLEKLSGIKIVSGQDIAMYLGIAAELKKLIAFAYLDCLCYAVVPPCPPPPCDNRIVLACLTIQDGRITDICHFPGRKQLITLQTLGYWLGPLGLDKIGLVLEEIFALVCCNAERGLTNPKEIFGDAAYNKEMVTTAGITSGADVHRIASHYLSQTLGASVVNVISPNTSAVDLRPMMNMESKMVVEKLREQGFQKVTMRAVDDDSSWTADAVNSSAQFTPSAVTAGQPLTVYTKGSVAVGFDVVDPTTAKIQDLQDQITALQNQLNQAAQQPAAAQQPEAAQQAAPAPQPATTSKAKTAKP